MLLFLAIGLLAGVLSGLFGIGGGIVIIPALLFFARFDPQTATGTSLGAQLLPVGVLGALAFYRKGHVNVNASLLLALGLFLGAYFGANLALRLPTRDLQRGFALFLIVVAGKMWWSA